jgi:hypothetical protein
MVQQGNGIFDDDATAFGLPKHDSIDRLVGMLCGMEKDLEIC